VASGESLSEYLPEAALYTALTFGSLSRLP